MQRWLARLVLYLATAMIPSIGVAQVFTFDDVCATPPCPIGTLYGPQGITFASAAAPIVAAGTSGLTGPNGGRYLAVNGPFMITLSLARPATYFSVRASRGSASTGPLTLTATFYRDGSIVAAPEVELEAVDEWSLLSFNLAAGFDQVRLSAAGALNREFGVDGVQIGGNCNGFADVQPGDIFCSAAEWLANRGVTLGCSPGIYCPTANVTRAQMALFMQRLGDAVAPIYVDTFADVTDFTTESTHITCVTSPIDIAVPMDALISGGFSFQPLAGPWTGSVRTAYSSQDDTTWSQFSAVVRQTAATGHYADATIQHVDRVGPGRVRFALGISRTAGSGNLSQGRCRVLVQLTGARSNALPVFDTAR